jgi:hypothetical protein
MYLGASELVLLVQDLPTFFPILALFLAPITCVILGLIYWLQTRAVNTSGNDERKLPMYTWKEFNARLIDGHAWVIIHETIYEISSIMDRHPGGSKAITDNIGKDVSKFFGGIDRGSNHTHSRFAESQIQIMAVGTTPPKTEYKTSGKDLESGGSASNILKTAPVVPSGRKVHVMKILERVCSGSTSSAESNYDAVVLLRIELPHGMLYLNSPGMINSTKTQDVMSNYTLMTREIQFHARILRFISKTRESYSC